MIPFADISFGQALLLILEVFLFVIWIWILIAIITDLFRDHSASGVVKAVWVFFLVFVPFLSALMYLIIRGDGMRQRAIDHQIEAKKQLDAYIQAQAGTGSSADELEKLHDLKEKGAISADEYDQMKSKVVS